MNIERIQRIKAIILEEPRRFIMESYQLGGPDMDDATWQAILPKGYEKPPCGTMACICGWSNILQRQDAGGDLFSPIPVWDEVRAARWLGITSSEAGTLFHFESWPVQFAERYKYAANPQDRAQVAADYIDHLCEQERERLCHESEFLVVDEPQASEKGEATHDG